MAKPSKVWKAFVLIAIILVVDQAVKIYIKTHFQLHESFRVTNWFYIYFTENSGMAFGWEFFDKIFLTLFRIIAAGLLIWYMVYISRKKQFPTGYVLSIALIIAGALGNVIDCVFYGLIFDHSYGQVAGFFPEGGGYAPIFYGKVVDMLFFPLINTTLPDWLPIWGGRDFLFFRPVFNIADTSITTGILILLIFYRSCLAEDTKGKKSKSDKAGSPLTT
ncbi:MAG: lipoprotein signal peptidase [Bacteroidales bacterium]|jgi:signal peptidase II|nr:lipoprotein signal peptidase [Bacteroidales bacterium]OQC02206.1 MAG: lipoprotein signal peptidase [Bacteroidetes bacterium ADurb.Bin090]MBP8981691.1 lipoprotein signal peptidase [Bacteroidales bacterium]NLV38975.1 lipoprotein signal peptidase [Bacteroidales bacterium]HNZ81049.1 lipoprotein signal peptidase [Bacteroidales bacterium]